VINDREVFRLPLGIAPGIGRVQMDDGQQAIGHRHGGGMAAAMAEEFRQHMGMRPGRTGPARGRDRLEHFDPAKDADEDPMGAERRHGRHQVVSGFENRPAKGGAQPGQGGGVAGPDAGIGLRQVEAEIEQDRFPVLRADRRPVGAEFRQDRAPAHGRRRRQAEHQGMVPVAGLAAGGFIGQRPGRRLVVQTDGAPRGGGRKPVDVEYRRLPRRTDEFGNGPEGAEAPAQCRIIQGGV